MIKQKTPNCTKCQSLTRVSSTYSNMWFCPSCGHGDYLKKRPNKRKLIKKDGGGYVFFEKGVYDFHYKITSKR